jgi:hypothetical protein
MVSTTKSTSAYDTLIGLRDKITCLNGIITPEGVDKLEDKLGGICTIIKTHHYTEGQKYGHLASIIPQNKYRIVIGNATWVHVVPANLGAYSAAALGVGNAAAQRKQLIAEHKVLQANYASYLGVEEAAKELILHACENICNGYLYDGDLVFVILKGIYGFKFPKRFLEISSRDLTSSFFF